jgi:hypothetical protein
MLIFAFRPPCLAIASATAGQRKAKNKNVLCVLGVFAVNMNINRPPCRGGIRLYILFLYFTLDKSALVFTKNHFPVMIPNIRNLRAYSF